MIRPFRLRDSLILQRLIRRSVSLQLERDLTQPSAPFWAALGAPLPWHGSGAATYLYLSGKKNSTPNGFVQAIKRLGRPEADITRIAPKEIDDKQAADVWEQLLRHMAAEAGEHGIQRLYIYISTTSPGYDLICNSGYTPYIRETIFRLPDIPASISQQSLSDSIRAQREADSFSLQRLYSRYTPTVVQKSEGMFSNNDDSVPTFPLRTWWLTDHNNGFVFEEKGEIIAAVQIHLGRIGHWLCIFGDPDAPAPIKELLEQSLSALSGARDRPIYCALRPYQNAFGPFLRELNFEEGPEMTRFVKHTTSFAKRPVVELGREAVEGSLPSLAPIEFNRKSA